MTHAAFHAPMVHAAALALHTRLRSEADESGIGTVNAAALHASGDLARFAAAVGEGIMHLDLADFGLIESEMSARPGAAA